MLGFPPPPEDQRDNYEKLEKIGHGSYSEVHKARDRRTGEIVAVKIVNFQNELAFGVPHNTMREAAYLMDLDHENVIKLKDVVYNEQEIWLVFEYFHMDLRKYLRSSPGLSNDLRLIKTYLYQILCGLSHCHSHRILHRDLKPENLLIDMQNQVLKITDFGLGKAFDYHYPFRVFTKEVFSLNYRPPEIILGARMYSTMADIWSVGCIFAEMVNHGQLFDSDCEIGLLFNIFSILGTPDEDTWKGVCSLPFFKVEFPKWAPKDLASLVPNLEPAGVDLLSKMLRFQPNTRISAREALEHEYFNDNEHA